MQNETNPRLLILQDITDSFLLRFWKRVDKRQSCWIWTGSKDDKGYGMMFVRMLGVRKSLTLRAHRISWVIHNGLVPDGLQVLHNCPGKDNPSCVNPAHLWIGTCLENCRDCEKKGNRYRFRVRYGEECNGAVLTEAIVREIRRVYANGGVSFSVLAKRFGIAVGHAHSIVRRKMWKHASDDPPTPLIQPELF